MPGETLTGSQLEKLGDRLRGGLTLQDLHLLRRFIDSLQPFADDTYERIRAITTEAPGLTTPQISRRANKTTRSIVAKLRRQTTKLAQIQDLIGCRIVVGDIIDQDRWADALAQAFPTAQIIDRRASPRHGYRAVHVIVREDIQRYEIQLRTRLQDEWANFVEKVSEHTGSDLKYGFGDPTILSDLEAASLGSAEVESIQRSFEARPTDPRYRFGKFFVATYLPDYRQALKEAYPEAKRLADQKASEAARRRAGLPAPTPFDLSPEIEETWGRAVESASASLRLVLWSSVKLPAGFELTLGRESRHTAEPIRVLGEIPIEDPSRDVESSAMFDLHDGRVYQITQPAKAENFLLSPDRASSISELLIEAEVPILNLASKLGLKEYLQ